MPPDSDRDDVPRDRAEWMVPTDDPLLELMRERGNMTPIAVEHLGVCTRSHASRRLHTLAKRGMVNQIGETSLFELTDRGRRYLDEEPLDPDGDPTAADVDQADEPES